VQICWHKVNSTYNKRKEICLILSNIAIEGEMNIELILKLGIEKMLINLIKNQGDFNLKKESLSKWSA